jgi:nicotinamide riboside transporter PnuC
MKLKKPVSGAAKKAGGCYEVIGWLGAGLVIFGYYLNAHQYLSCWLVWIAGNLCVTGYSTYKKAWPTAAMSVIITIMNIYGYVNWMAK